MPTLIPDFIGIRCTGSGLPPSAANEVRELANVLTRMPNQATEYEPAMPIRLNAMTMATRAHGNPTRKP